MQRRSKALGGFPMMGDEEEEEAGTFIYHDMNSTTC